MSNGEKELAVIKDIATPKNIGARYDIYFTDKRIAFIYLGRKNDGPLYLAGLAGGLVGALVAEGINVADRKIRDRHLKKKEEQISGLVLDDLLKLNKECCYYTYDEIEEIKMISGKHQKVLLLSEECEAELTLTPEQYQQFNNIVLSIDALKAKLKS